MTHVEIEVLVMDGDRPVQRWPCRAVDMVDGRRGVIWRGVTYTLLAGDQIDISAAAQDVAPPVSHAVLTGEDETWVLLAGLERAMLAARQALNAGGIVVLRAGRWLGEPTGDFACDWFICCDGPIAPLRIDTLLGASARALADDPAMRAERLERMLLEAKVDISRLQTSLLRQVAAPTDSHELTEAKATIANLQAALEQTRVPSLTQIRPPLPAVSLRLEAELAKALQALRPDIRLLRNSLLVAFGEYASPAGFWRVVSELPASGGRPEGWKKVQAADRWWESHVSTGRDNTGRAYAQFDPARRIWHLLLSSKGEQQRDFDWLRR